MTELASSWPFIPEIYCCTYELNPRYYKHLDKNFSQLNSAINTYLALSDISSKEIHRVIHEVVQLKQAGNDEQAMKVFEKITPLSQQVIDIIDKIISKI